MQIVRSLMLFSLASCLMLSGWARTQGQTPGHSLVGGTWQGTIVRYGSDGQTITIQAKVRFAGDGTFTGTLTQLPWGPFQQPIVTHTSGRWWLEDPHTLVMMGHPPFRGSIRWIDNNTVETTELAVGTRVIWTRAG